MSVSAASSVDFGIGLGTCPVFSAFAYDLNPWYHPFSLDPDLKGNNI
jgi:hypothetical protein